MCRLGFGIFFGSYILLTAPTTDLSFRTLVKRVEVGLSVQQVEEETVEEIMVQGGAVSPIVTIEPRRRKFHKAITITMPLPERMSAQYLRRRQNESLKLSQKQQGKTPIGSFFLQLCSSLDPTTHSETTNPECFNQEKNQ